MTDPKLDQIPSNPQGSSEQERGAQIKRPRPGLSINDTIAGNANLSVGGRGVDTSGVGAGAGAGAGSTMLTPGDSGSPAPTIVPGASSTGTTLRAGSGLNTSPNPGAAVQRDTGGGPTDDEIAQLAHQYWVERGSPQGSPELDWNRARQELLERHRKRAMSTIGASA